MFQYHQINVLQIRNRFFGSRPGDSTYIIYDYINIILTQIYNAEKSSITQLQWRAQWSLNNTGFIILEYIEQQNNPTHPPSCIIKTL